MDQASQTGFEIVGPLAKVPENSMKFVVGALLTGFGVFWCAEGLRRRGREAIWPFPP